MPELYIAILGAGKVGGTLGRKWVKAGHTVAFGVTNLASERAESLRQEFGSQVFIGSPEEALANSKVVLLAVPGDVVEEVIATYAHLLDHKIILDAANKYRNGSNRNYANHNPQWNEPELNSLSFIQAHAPHAQAYRAFNSYSIHPFADPIYQGVQADLFYCGPAGAERALVEQLITEIGLRPIYLGDSNVVEVVDGVIRLWAALVLLQDKGMDHVAFKVLTR